MSITLATRTILQLCCDMDVKGTMSGKNYIHRNCQPVDVLGFMLKEHGYQFPYARRDSPIISPDGIGGLNPYHESRKLLGLPRPDQGQLKAIYHEIDRHNSTNASIKEMIIRQCQVPSDIAEQYRSQGTVDDTFETL